MSTNARQLLVSVSLSAVALLACVWFVNAPLAIAQEPLDGSTKTVQPSGEVSPGDTLTYTLVLSNVHGTEDITATMRDELPDHTSINTNTIAGGATYSNTEHALAWSGVISAHTNITFTYHLTVNDTLVDPVTLLTNMATYSTAALSTVQQVSATVQARAPATPSGVVGLIDVNEPIAYASQNLVYTVAFSNTESTSKDVVVSSHIPDNTTFVTSDAGAVYDDIARTVSYTNTLNGLEEVSFTYQVVVSPTILSYEPIAATLVISQDGQATLIDTSTIWTDCGPMDWAMDHISHDRQGQSPYVGQPETGNLKLKPRWIFTEATDSIVSTVVMSNGTSLVAGSRDGILRVIETNPVLVPNLGPKNPPKVTWEEDLGHAIISEPAIAHDGTIIIAADSYVYAFVYRENAVVPRWTYNAHDDIASSPLISPYDGTIYVATGTGVLHAIYPDGTTRWTYDTQEDSGYAAPALANDGTIFFTTEYSVFAITRDGTLKWREYTDIDRPGYSRSTSIHATPLIGSDGYVYVVSTQTQSFWLKEIWLFAFHPDDGSARLFDNDIDLYSPVFVGYGSTETTEFVPAVSNDDEIIYVASQKALFEVSLTQQYSRILFSFKKEDGDEIISSPVVDTDGKVYFVSSDGGNGVVHVLDDEGTEVSNYESHQNMEHAAVAIGNDGTIYISDVNGQVYALVKDTTPTDVRCVPSTVKETIKPNEQVCKFVAQSPVIDTYTYTILSALDPYFKIVTQGDEVWLYTADNADPNAQPLDLDTGVNPRTHTFETKVINSTGFEYIGNVVITVQPVNEFPPTNVSLRPENGCNFVVNTPELSCAGVNEDIGNGTIIGHLVVEDKDRYDTHSFGFYDSCTALRSQTIQGELSEPDYGRVSVNNNANFNYENTANPAHTCLLEVTVDNLVDIPQQSFVKQLTLEIHDVNERPDAIDDVYYGAVEGQPYVVTAANGVLKNDTDQDLNDTLTIELITTVDLPHGTINTIDTATGAFTYTPDDNFSGEERFQYRIFDKGNLKDTAWVTIHVNDVAELCTLTNNPLRVDEGASVPITSHNVQCDDPDGDAITYIVRALPQHGTLTITSTTTPIGLNSPIKQQDIGNIVYNHFGHHEPDNDPATHDDVIGFMVQENGITSQEFDLKVFVNAINEAPTATPDVYAVNENSVLNVPTERRLLKNDTDPDVNDTLNIVDIVLPNRGALSNIDYAVGMFTYTPEAGYVGEDHFMYTIEDSGGLRSTTQVTISVNNVADPCVLSIAPVTVREGETVPINDGNLFCDDPDGDPVEYTIRSLPQHGKLMDTRTDPPHELGIGSKISQQAITSGSILYVHNGDELNNDTIGLVLNDGRSIDLIVNVTSTNDTPTVTHKPIEVREGDYVLITSATLSADDNDLPKDLSKLVYTINPTQSVGSFQRKTMNAAGEDEYLDVTSFSQADINNSLIRFLHNGAEQPLNDTFGFTVNDGAGGSTPYQTGDITVISTDDPPFIKKNTGVSINECQTDVVITQAMLAAADNDHLDPADLTFYVKKEVQHGTLLLNLGNATQAIGINGTFTQQDINDGKLMYSHDCSEENTASFDVVVRSGQKESAKATFTIAITGINDTPTISSVADQTTPEDTSKDVVVTIADVDIPAQTLVVTATVSQQGEQLLPNERINVAKDGTRATITLSPAANRHGTASVTVCVSDGTANACDTFNLTVTPVADPPVITLNKPYDEDTPGGYWNVTRSPVDGAETTHFHIPSVNNVTFYKSDCATVIGDATSTFVTVTEGQTLCFTSKQNFFGNVPLNVCAAMGNTLTDVGANACTNDTIVIEAVNDPPVVQKNDPLKDVPEGEEKQITDEFLLVADIYDDANNDITYWVKRLPVNGTLLKNGQPLAVDDTFTQADINTGIIRYQHDGTKPLNDTILLEVKDNNGASIATPDGTLEFLINMANQNDAPIVEKNELLRVPERNEGVACVTLTSEYLLANDEDNSDDELRFTIVDKPDNGTIHVGGAEILSFTNADIKATPSRVQYCHNGSETQDDSFTFDLSDGAGGYGSNNPYKFIIKIITENDKPTISAIDNVQMDEDTDKTMSFTISDEETAAQNVTVNCTSSNATLIPNDGQHCIIEGAGNARQVRVKPAAHAFSQNNTPSQLDVCVNDGKHSVCTVFNVTVAPVADAPDVQGKREIYERTQVTETILKNKVDNEEVTHFYIDQLAQGTLTKSDGTDIKTGTFITVGEGAQGVIFTPTDQNPPKNGEFRVRAATCNENRCLGAETIVDITVNDVNDPPTIGVLNRPDVDECLSKVIDHTMLRIDDIDMPPPDQLVLTVVDEFKYGSLYNKQTGKELKQGATFTQKQLYEYAIEYRHRCGEEQEDVFAFTVSDGRGGTIPRTEMFIRINPVNDPPTLTVRALLIDESVQNEAKDVTDRYLNATDPDNEDSELIYTIIKPPVNGTLMLYGIPLQAGDTFTQNDIKFLAVTYKHTKGKPYDDDTVVFKLCDTYDPPACTEPQDLCIEIRHFEPDLEITVDNKYIVGGKPTISEGESIEYCIKPTVIVNGVISITIEPDEQTSVQPETLYFSGDENDKKHYWKTKQCVTIHAHNDNVTEVKHSSTVNHRVTQCADDFDYCNLSKGYEFTLLEKIGGVLQLSTPMVRIGGSAFIFASTDNITQTELLSPTQQAAVPNGVQLQAATPSDDSGGYQRTCAASGGVFVTLTQTATNTVIKRGTACLYDDGTHGDIRANDEIYTTDYVFDNFFEGNVEVKLFLAAPHANYDGGDIPLDSKHLAVVQEQTNPELIVITDWKAIYEEFKDTGGMPDKTDENKDPSRGNCDDDPENSVHDFVSFVGELVRFTNHYSGTIIDVTQEISTTNGYSGNYADIPYLGATVDELARRHSKAQLIDELVNKYTTGEYGQTKYVFLVGDDEVIPQSRIPDPTDTYCTGDKTSGCSLERGYLPDDNHTNEVLFDITQGYIMSDLPYATTYVENISLAHNFWLSDEAKRDELRKPKPDLRAGRVFAKSPCDLKRSLQRYMKPLKVDKVDVGDGNWASRAFVGAGTPYENSDGDVDDSAINAILTGLFASVTDKHYPPWSESDLFAGFWKTVKTQPGMVLLTLIGHADHQSFTHGAGNNDKIPGLAYSDLTLEDSEYMSVVMTVLGCHYGLPLCKGSETIGDRFTEANVHNLMDGGRDIALFAPTGVAHTIGLPGDSNLVTLAPSLNSRLISLFINRMGDQAFNSIGDVWRSTYESYIKTYPNFDSVEGKDPGDLFHIKAAYAMTFLGSPMQSLGRDIQDLCPTPQTASTQPGAALMAVPAQRNNVSLAATTLMSATVTTVQTETKILTITPNVTSEQLMGTDEILYKMVDATNVTLPNGAVLPAGIRTLVFTGHVTIKDVAIQHTATREQMGVKLATSKVNIVSGGVVDGKPFDLPTKYPADIIETEVFTDVDQTLVSVTYVPVKYYKDEQRAVIYDTIQVAVTVEREVQVPVAMLAATQLQDVPHHTQDTDNTPTMTSTIMVKPVVGTNQVNVYPNGVTGNIVLALSVRNSADEVTLSGRVKVILDGAKGDPPVVAVTFKDFTFTEGYSFIPKVFLCGGNTCVGNNCPPPPSDPDPETGLILTDFTPNEYKDRNHIGTKRNPEWVMKLEYNDGKKPVSDAEKYNFVITTQNSHNSLFPLDAQLGPYTVVGCSDTIAACQGKLVKDGYYHIKLVLSKLVGMGYVTLGENTVSITARKEWSGETHESNTIDDIPLKYNDGIPSPPNCDGTTIPCEYDNALEVVVKKFLPDNTNPVVCPASGGNGTTTVTMDVAVYDKDNTPMGSLQQSNFTLKWANGNSITNFSWEKINDNGHYRISATVDTSKVCSNNKLEYEVTYPGYKPKEGTKTIPIKAPSCGNKENCIPVIVTIGLVLTDVTPNEYKDRVYIGKQQSPVWVVKLERTDGNTRMPFRDAKQDNFTMMNKNKYCGENEYKVRACNSAITECQGQNATNGFYKVELDLGTFVQNNSIGPGSKVDMSIAAQQTVDATTFTSNPIEDAITYNCKDEQCLGVKVEKDFTPELPACPANGNMPGTTTLTVFVYDEDDKPKTGLNESNFELQFVDEVNWGNGNVDNPLSTDVFDVTPVEGKEGWYDITITLNESTVCAGDYLKYKVSYGNYKPKLGYQSIHRDNLTVDIDDDFKPLLPSCPLSGNVGDTTTTIRVTVSNSGGTVENLTAENFGVELVGSATGVNPNISFTATAVNNQPGVYDITATFTSDQVCACTSLKVVVNYDGDWNDKIIDPIPRGDYIWLPITLKQSK